MLFMLLFVKSEGVAPAYATTGAVVSSVTVLFASAVGLFDESFTVALKIYVPATKLVKFEKLVELV